MAESILEQNVILEIAEIAGSDDILTSVQTGTITHRDYTGCEDSGLSNISFNNPVARKTFYAGDAFLLIGAGGYYQGIGDPLQGCQSLVTQSNGLIHNPAQGTGDKLVELRLGNTSVSTVPSNQTLPFNDATRVSYTSSSPHHWRVDNSQDKDENVQGRCLYMEDSSSSNKKTYCWEVYDKLSGVGDTLLLKGNGKDEVSDIGVLCPPLDTGTDILDWYISPYIHSGRWSSREPYFTWNNRDETKVMSYNGKIGNGNYRENPSFTNSGILGFRSDDFDDLILGNSVLDCWELEINVSSIVNAKIDIFETQATNILVSQSNPDPIIRTGLHTFCLSSLVRESAIAATGYETTNVSGSGSETQYKPFVNQVRLLKASSLDSGSPSSLRIDSIKLTKKNPGFFVYDEPIYQTGVAYSIDRYNWNHLDIKESGGIPLSLTFSVGDLKDISKRTSGYSKTFLLPSNKHNNEILTPMLAVGAERVMIHWMKARIKVNGIHVFGGLMRVEEGNTGQGGFYKCHIIQDTIGWSQALGEDTLCDLALEGPGGISPAELKSYTSVKNSWDDNPDTSDFIYGLVNYGEWQAQSVNPNPSTHDYNHNTDDFHPTVFAKALTDKIFSSKGYSIESNFFESETFKKLCHPWVSGENYTDGSLFESGGTQAAHLKLIEKTTAGGDFASGGKVPASGFNRNWYPNIILGSDLGNNWTTNSQYGGYIAPFTGTYFGQIKAKMYINQTFLSNGSYMTLDLVKNGSIVTLVNGHSQTTQTIERDPAGLPSIQAMRSVSRQDSGVNNGLTRIIEFSIDLNAGDSLSMRMRGVNLSNVFPAYMDASHMEMDVYPVPSSTSPDKIVNLSKVLPCMKQMDYLKGLTEVFNLQWTANEETKTVYCEPYNDFFGSGKVVDWSKKLDYKSWNDKFIIEELAKEIHFKYKEDTGDKFSNQIYRWRESAGYDIVQSHLELNDEKFRSLTMEMGTEQFSTTVMFNAYGKQPNPNQHANGDYAWGDLTWTDPQSNKNNPLMPAIWKDSGHINTQQRPDFNMVNPKFDMRLLNYYGKTSCSQYEFLDSSATSHTEDEYPHLGHINEWLKGVQPDPYNLSWDDVDDGYGNVSVGLFTKYWRVAYLKMNGGAALRTCKMNLTANDISQFDYRDLILLKIDEVATYWTVNKIKDYNPNKNELTTVELIEWKQSKDFGKSTSTAHARVAASPSQGSIVGQSHNQGLVLRNSTKNSSIGTGIAFGNGVVAKNNQTVLGNYNQPNNSDILQVGSGSNQSDRMTALTIKNSGEVEIHGGEINIEETDGIIHDLVYTDSDGNIQKLYLKKE